MTLEDIHHAWRQHVTTAVVQQEKDGVALLDRRSCKGWTPPRPRPLADMLFLPSFLHAFTDLARVKYCHHGGGGNNGPGDRDGDWDDGSGDRAVTLLLLRDVFNNIATRTALRVSKRVCLLELPRGSIG